MYEELQPRYRPTRCPLNSAIYLGLPYDLSGTSADSAVCLGMPYAMSGTTTDRLYGATSTSIARFGTITAHASIVILAAHSTVRPVVETSVCYAVLLLLAVTLGRAQYEHLYCEEPESCWYHNTIDWYQHGTNLTHGCTRRDRPPSRTTSPK
eukprot:3333482-Rhodomonas_salina.1